MRHPLIRALIAALLASAMATAGGCATVQPWQRGVQGDRRMQWARCPERSGAREHVYNVREGTAGGLSGSGGGCGCD